MREGEEKEREGRRRSREPRRATEEGQGKESGDAAAEVMEMEKEERLGKEKYRYM